MLLLATKCSGANLLSASVTNLQPVRQRCPEHGASGSPGAASTHWPAGGASDVDPAPTFELEHFGRPVMPEDDFAAAG